MFRRIRLNLSQQVQVVGIVHPKVVTLLIQREDEFLLLRKLAGLDREVMVNHILRLGTKETILTLLQLLELPQSRHVLRVSLLVPLLIHLDVIILVVIV